MASLVAIRVMSFTMYCREAHQLCKLAFLIYFSISGGRDGGGVPNEREGVAQDLCP